MACMAAVLPQGLHTGSASRQGRGGQVKSEGHRCRCREDGAMCSLGTQTKAPAGLPSGKAMLPDTV